EPGQVDAGPDGQPDPFPDPGVDVEQLELGVLLIVKEFHLAYPMIAELSEDFDAPLCYGWHIARIDQACRAKIGRILLELPPDEPANCFAAAVQETAKRIEAVNARADDLLSEK